MMEELIIKGIYGQDVSIATTLSRNYPLPSTKDSTYPRYTERAVRRLIKIFTIEDTSVADDVAELGKKFEYMRNTETAFWTWSWLGSDRRDAWAGELSSKSAAARSIANS